MSSLQGKSLEALTEQDLQQLITQSEQESQTLDYKRELYKHNDEDTREMLRDIAAMANSFGGDILIGVEEDRQGVAVDLPGIEKAEEEAHRIVSSCLSNIAERIEGLHTQFVPLQTGRCVLVIRIPRSLRAPHMVTFKGLNQFWMRHDRQKSPMSIQEIKDTCLKVEGLMEKLERFLAQRRQSILEDIGDIPHYLVSITPLFIHSETVNIRDATLHALLDNPPPFHNRNELSLRVGPVRYTLHGLRMRDDTEDTTRSVELFRNGHLELLVTASRLLWKAQTNNPQQASHHFCAAALSGYTLAFSYLASAIFTHTGISDPFVISLSFYNIKRVWSTL